MHHEAHPSRPTPPPADTAPYSSPARAAAARGLSLRSTEELAREVLAGQLDEFAALICAANDDNLAAWTDARAKVREISETVDQVVRTIDARRHREEQLRGVHPGLHGVFDTLFGRLA